MFDAKLIKPSHSNEVLVKWDEGYGCVSWFVAYWSGKYWHAKTDHLKAEGHWERPMIESDFKQEEIVAWKELE